MQAVTVVLLNLILFNNLLTGFGNETEWEGKWFPKDANESDENHVHAEADLTDLHDAKHGIKMGVKNHKCDDAENRLAIDYDGSAINYTCYANKNLYLPDPRVHPILDHENIPHGFSAKHYCMHRAVEYETPLPTFGPHRPLWAKYGEYNFAPPQRWLHNLEHGAIVMLYHPCADAQEVNRMKKIVKSCLYRHVISASQHLTPERPLALLSWGYRMVMPKFDLNLTVNFIKEHFNHGGERTSKNGQYKLGLISPAEFVSDKRDHNLCPFYA